MQSISLILRSLSAAVLAFGCATYAAAETVVGSIPGSFAVSLSGSATYTVPIKIAPGASGTEPKIQLSYDSQAPAGVIGAGWSISGFSVIARGPREQSVDGEVGGVTFDDSDALFLDGQRIIPVRPPQGTGSSRTVEFRKRVDDQTRIFQVGPTLERSYFEVRTKGGLTLLFGNIENARDKPDNSVIRFKDGKVLGFAESIAIDTSGNFIEFKYESTQDGEAHVSQVNYTGLGRFTFNPTSGSVASFIRDLCPFASVQFDYNTKSQRKLQVFVAGHEIIKEKRLEGIRSWVSADRFDSSKDCDPSSASAAGVIHQVSRYGFEYDLTDTANRYLLRKMRLFGEDDAAELRPTEFSYTKPAVGWTQNPFTFPNSAVLAEQGRLAAGYRFAHFTPGRGSATDLLFSVQSKTGLVALAFRNNGLVSGKPLWTPIKGFEPPIPFIDTAGNDLGVIVADILGNGRVSLLQHNSFNGTETNSAYMPDATHFAPDDNYKLPFLVSKDGKVVAQYRFAFWTGGKGPDLIYKSGSEAGFLKNGGPGIGWERQDKLAPPVDLDARSYLVDLDCNGGRPALIGAKPDTAGVLQWAVYRFNGTNWAEEKRKSDFDPPFPPGTDPEAVRQLKIATPSGTCDGFIVSDARTGQKPAAYAASSTGWKAVPRKAPEFDLIDKNGHVSRAVVADVDGDGRQDVIANRNFADGTTIRFAFRQTSSRWISDSSFVPPLLGTEGSASSEIVYVGDIGGTSGADIVLPDTAQSLPQDRAGIVAKIFLSSDSGFEPHPDLTGPIAFSRKDKKDLGVRMIDLHGRGLPDVIVSRRVTENGTTKLVSAAYRNTGSGWQEEPGECSTPAQQDPDAPTGLCPPLPFAGDEINGNPAEFVDLDGDGFPDMIYSYKDKAGVITTKFYLNVADKTRCEECRRWINLEKGRPDLMKLVKGLDVFPLASYGIGDMGVRFAKFDANRLGVMVGFRGAGTQECHRWGSAIRDFACGIGLGPFLPRALVFDGASWRAADAYKPPVPFVTQYNDPQGPSIDLSVQTINATGGPLPDLMAYYTDPVLQSMPWPHDPETIAHVWVNHGNGWTRNDSIIVPVDAAKRDPKALVQLADVNGDGLPDIVVTRSDNPSGSATWLGTGSGWVQRPQWRVPAEAISTVDGDPGFRLVDTKGDGFLDVLWMRTNPDGSKSKGLYLNNGTDWSVRGTDSVVPDLSFTDKDGVDQGVRLLSVTGKGLTDIIRAYAGDAPVVETNNSRRADVLESVVDGYGLKTNVFYETLLEADGADPNSGIAAGGPLGRFAYERGPPDAYPLVAPVPTMYVVRNAQVDQGDGTIVPFFYRYGGYRIDASLTQPLGFKWRESLNPYSRVLSRTEFVQDFRLRNGVGREATCLIRTDELSTWPAGTDFPADLCPEGKIITDWGQKLNETRNCWAVWEGDLKGVSNEMRFPAIADCESVPPLHTLTGPIIRQSVLSKVLTTTYELDGRVSTAGADTFAYKSNSDILKNDGNVTKTISALADGTSVTTDNTYEDDPDRWFLGRLTQSIVTKVGEPKAPGDANRKTEQRCSAYLYDPRTGLLSDEIVNCAHPKAVRTHYDRDQFGNVQAKTISAQGELPQTVSSTFDSLGRFAVAGTDALGHRSEKTFSLTTGQPLTAKDINGLTTTFSYDTFGRLWRQINPDGVVSTTEFVDRNDIPKIASADLARGLPVTPQYAVKSQVGSLPFTVALFDTKGRAVRTVSNAFTPDEARPRYVFKDTQYDPLGNITRSSLPFEPNSTPVWSSNEFDALKRVCASTAPNGLRTETLYAGLTAGGAEVVVVVDPGQQLSGTDVFGKPFLACGRPFPQASYRAQAANRRTSSQINMRKLLTQATDALGSVRYEYDAGGRLERMTGPTGAVTENIYDELGNKITTSDPDLGNWQYAYDAFGRVVGQVDAKNQLSTMQYDVGNRPVRRVLQDVTTTWTYDTAGGGTGKIASISNSNGYAEQFIYDRAGRLARDVITIGNEQFVTSTEYDQFGRVSKLYYPTSFAVRNHYDAKGFLVAVSDLRDGNEYWSVRDIDIYGHVTKEVYGNGVVTTRAYNAKDLRPQEYTSFKAGYGSILEMKLSYDLTGNLKSRSELVEHKKETFCYDELDRLRSIGTRTCDHSAITFDASGRIRSKSGVGRYEYVNRREATGAYSKPFHAVQRTRFGRRTSRYAYDLNGNMVSAPGKRFEYTSDNHLSLLFANEMEWVRFDYGPDGGRFRQFSRHGSRAEETVYAGAFERVVDYSQPATDNYLRPVSISRPERLSRYRHYLSNGSGVFAVVETQRTYANSILDRPKSRSAPAFLGGTISQEAWYLHSDQLGSIIRITDQNGHIRQRLWYDPWGRRDVKLNDKPGRRETQRLAQSWKRGFTGHEHLDTFNLIHMNGRVYNPILGVFLTVDAINQMMTDTQSGNGYAYARGNPLRYIDPSGEGWLGRALGGVWRAATAPFRAAGDAIGAIGRGVGHFFSEAGKWLSENWRTVVIVAAVIAVTVVTGGAGLTLTGAILSGMAAGATGGALGAALYGGSFEDIVLGALKGAVVGGASGAAFWGVGTFFTPAAGQSLSTTSQIESVAAHGVVGGAKEAVEGGDFWKGFVATAATKASNAFGPDFHSYAGNVARAAVVGGTVAQMTGGKFANGAILGAFSYTFNDAANHARASWVAAGAMLGGGAALVGAGAGALPSGGTSLLLSPEGVSFGAALGGALGGAAYDALSATPTLPDYDFWNPARPPVDASGREWEWHGKPPEGGSKGGWTNPQDRGESIHPDLNHPKHGPHWDYNCGGSKWRCYEDGRVEQAK
ncbi:RHS repeat-associated core domain-containing protein [Methylobacterium brachiatum]